MVVQVLIVALKLQQFSGNAQAVEIWESKELNCALALPISQGWIRVSPPVEMMKVAIRYEAGVKTIALFVVDTPQDGRTLQSFIPKFKKSWFREDISSKRSEAILQIDGRSAHRLMDTVKIQGVEMHRVNTVVIDNGRVYQITAMSRDGDPLTDPEILETIKSFHFLSPGAKLPIRISTQDPANRLPELIGRITIWMLGGIVVIYLIFKANAQGKAKSGKGRKGS